MTANISANLIDWNLGYFLSNELCIAMGCIHVFSSQSRDQFVSKTGHAKKHANTGYSMVDYCLFWVLHAETMICINYNRK